MEIHDVAVVGLGPVGAAGAIFFAHAGLTVAVIERDRQVHPLPRAVGMDGEVVRAFQGIGRGEEFNALLQDIRPNERAGFANSNREWMFGQDLLEFAHHGWAPFAMFHQPEVDEYLRDTAIAHPNVTSFVGYELCGLHQSADYVTLRVNDTDTDEQIEIYARYVVACDGASSFVRGLMDVPRRSLGYDRDWLVIDVKMNDNALLPPEVLQVCDPDRITTYVGTKDPYRRWEFKLNDGETSEEMLKEERIMQLLDPWTPRGTYNIERAAVYQFHALVTEQWRQGRIFLAGDAAHQTPPFLGQGMNAGMRDVANLAWKLPRVIAGTSPDSLLDTYFEEREAHSEDLIEWASNIGKLMEFLADTEAHEKGKGPAPGEPPAMSAAYGQGRLIPPLRDGVLIKSQASDTGFTGYQIDQPMVRDANGKEYRLDEALGTGFAILARTPQDLKLSKDAKALADKMQMTLISLEGLEATKWQLDKLFENHAAVIIRPDRYIFGHTDDAHSLDDLIKTLATKLGVDAPAPAPTVKA